ncbi:MAG: hypothetical protein IJ059_03240 [Prevotella sp.]|nr:hypothetical protein [Prevotella sp.]
MSKAEVKKYIKSLERDTLEELVMVILHNCESSGWGFPDAMWDIYYDYSDKEEE